ncbi:MAG: AAA family ATPase [Clostridia bacterium]|nr:AAA family ATPase [Clostridia bacterium]
MGFRDFKKQLKLKREQEETMRALNGAIVTLTRKRDEYAQKAKEALKKGNESQYKAMVALLKNAMFNLAQAEDMVANFTIAKDLCEMQHLNKKFVNSLDSVMENVYKTCKAIHVSNSEKMFMKALYQQSITSAQLQQALKNNNSAFSSSVDSVSDISDDDVRELLNDEISRDSLQMDDTLAALEKEFAAAQPQVETPTRQPQVEGVTPAPAPVPATTVRPKPENKPNTPAETPEDKFVNGDAGASSEFKFNWDSLPSIRFEDIAGLEQVKEVVEVKVLLPLKNPQAFEGYEKKNGGGLCLYGPPGTGKTMIAAAIANEIGAKFCSVKPSDLLHQGAGNTEKAVRALFAQAREFPCAVIYFDEMDSISPKSTKSQYAKQLRSEFLAQLQGIDSYKKDTGNILFLIAATNKPWDIDSAFLRPGRFGTKIYVGLPDAPAREYMINKRLVKITEKGVVAVRDDINLGEIVEKTNGFNGSDITNLLDRIEEISIIRGIKTQEKYISGEDFEEALQVIHSSVQAEDIIKLNEWKSENDK